MKKQSSLKSRIIAAALTEPAFRDKLVREPRAAISARFKVTLPAKLQVEVLQDTPDKVTIVLPLLPGSGQLPDELLDAVSGGAAQCSNSSPAGLMSVLGPLG